MKAATPDTQAPHRRLYRARDGRQLAGVASGLAEHLGLSVTLVRVAFALMTVAGGMGLLLYIAFWVVVPDAAAPDSDEPANRWAQAGQIGALFLLGCGALLLLQELGLDPGDSGLLPLAAALVGVAIVWRQADPEQRARWRATAAGRRGVVVRVLVGTGLLLGGLVGFLATRGSLRQAREGLLSTVVVVGGLAVLSGPWWFRLTTDLRAERHERIRSQERAEVAAHVHDSVLQTLALIRKAADDPREVQRLARSQERDLRSWLYEPAAGTTTLARALERAAAEVEESHGATVDVVVVGDCPTGDAVTAVIAAAREAMVNAAQHSGAPSVAVYAEVEPEKLTVFVRDRGKGFDPKRRPKGRFGLAESVIGRMERHGGTAAVRSTKGEGTEIELVLPRA